MQLTSEQQELVDFFQGRALPDGPQHINAYSVFLNLPGAVATQLQRLHSEAAATRKSAVVMLKEVKEWVLQQAETEQRPD